MYTVPDVDEVVAVAKELGIHLGPEEAAHLMEQLSQLDAFVQARSTPVTRRSPSPWADGGGNLAGVPAGAAARGSEPADELRA